LTGNEIRTALRDLVRGTILNERLDSSKALTIIAYSLGFLLGDGNVPESDLESLLAVLKKSVDAIDETANPELYRELITEYRRLLNRKIETRKNQGP
jgi:hypothetical protein